MASTPDFKYAPMFQLGKDTTEYRLLSKEGVSTGEFEGKTILKVSKEALTLLAQQAFHDVEFMLRREHNLQVAKILSDPEASENDKYVALQFLRNAETACKGYPSFLPGHWYSYYTWREGTARMDRLRGRGGFVAWRIQHIHRGQSALLAERSSQHVRRG